MTSMLRVLGALFGAAMAASLSAPAGAEPAARLDFSPMRGYAELSCAAGYEFDPAVGDCVELGNAALCPPEATDVGEGCLCPGEVFVEYGAEVCPALLTPTSELTPTEAPSPTAEPTPTEAPTPTSEPTVSPTYPPEPTYDPCGPYEEREVECITPTDIETPGPSTTPAGIQNVPGAAQGPALPAFLFVIVAGVIVLLLWARRERH